MRKTKTNIEKPYVVETIQGVSAIVAKQAIYRMGGEYFQEILERKHQEDDQSYERDSDRPCPFCGDGLKNQKIIEEITRDGIVLATVIEASAPYDWWDGHMLGHWENHNLAHTLVIPAQHIQDPLHISGELDAELKKYTLRKRNEALSNGFVLEDYVRQPGSPGMSIPEHTHIHNFILDPSRPIGEIDFNITEGIYKLLPYEISSADTAKIHDTLISIKDRYESHSD